MSNIYDGIQRRSSKASQCISHLSALAALKSIADISESIYIPRGINTQALDREIKWDFNPADLKVGDHVSGGDIFGSVYENSLLDSHKVMLNPRAMGTITHLAEKGSYTVEVGRLL
jgi:V-type H+-transporting ATPase subunit A